MNTLSSESIRVLLVDDDAEDAVLTQQLLQGVSSGAYLVDWRDGFDSGLAALAEADYDVMLLDYRLSGENGLDLLRSARARGTRSPAILLTGQIDRDLDLKAMQAGVVDFLEKSHLNSSTLERSVRYAAGRGRAERERVVLFDAERLARAEAEAAHDRTAAILRTLERERTLFREVLEQLPIGVVMAEYPFGRLTHANAEMGRMLRYSVTGRAEAIALPEWVGFHDDGTRYEAEDWPLARTLATGKSVVDEEVRMSRTDGTAAKIRLHSTLVRGSDGEGLTAVMTLEDVTASSDAVDAIRFQADLLNAVEQSVIATDLTGAVTYWNSHAQGLYGWAPEYALGRNINDLNGSEATRDAFEAVLRIVESGEAWSGEMILQRQNGPPFPAYTVLSPLRNRAGKVVGIVGISIDVTERHHAEMALRESEAFFRAAFLGSAVPSLLVTTDGHVTQANEAMCALLGHPLDCLVGKSVLAFTEPSDRHATEESRLEMLAGLTDFAQVEKRYVHRDGHLIDVLVTIALVRLLDGTATHFTTQVFDITEHKRSQFAVMEREQHLAQIVAVQQEVATMALEDTRIVDLIVERARSLTGADGASVAMLDDMQLTIRASTAAAIPIGMTWNVEGSLTGQCILQRRPVHCNDMSAAPVVNRMLGGNVGAQSLICVPLLDDDTPVGVLTVWHHDINAFTDRDVHTLQLMAGLAAAGLAHTTAFAAKQALVVERTLALTTLGERETLIRSLIENAADPLITLDEKGLISYASPALERLLGRPTTDFIGVHPTELCHPDDRALMVETLAQMIATTRRNVAVEARLEHRDGSWRTLRVTGRNMLEDPAVRGIIVNLHDMTDEALVASQLRQAQKLEAVGQLAGGVAHDFNNLLTVISGHSEFLAESFDRHDPRHDDVEEIRLAAKRAAGLTRQLLAFSRQQILQPRIVNMNAIVAGLQPMLGRLIGEDINFVVRPTTDVATVLADPGQLEQVLMNLVINGRDAMPSGGTLTIDVQLVDLDSAYPRDHGGVVPGRYVMLAVTDTGLGMSKEVREQIFDPFFTTKDAGKGTGLGLSTVYGIVKQSNGYIWAYSEPGLWSTFKVYFPLNGNETSTRNSGEVRAIPRGSETVLLVEDEEAVRGISRRILTGQGYRVIEARDGVHALEVAAAYDGTIHLLVTDVVMPRMNGRALADQLNVARPGLCVLYLSGYTNDEILRRSPTEADGRLRLLQKPFTTQGLAAAVREALSAPIELIA